MKMYLRVILTAFLITFYLMCPDTYFDNSAQATPQVSPAEESENTDSPPENISSSMVYAVQVSACLEEKNTRNTLKMLKDKGYTPDLYTWKDVSGTLWHVIFIGLYETFSEADDVSKQYWEKEKRPVYVKSLAPSSLRVVEEEKPSPKAPPGKEAVGHLVDVVIPEKKQAATEVPRQASKEERAVPDDPRDVSKEESVENQEEELGWAELSWNGFVEFESFVNTGPGQNFRNANMKNEIRNRIEIKYGTENLYLFTASNMYLFQTYLNDHAQETYAYSTDRTVSRNLRLSSQEAELCFDELYLNFGMGNFRLRMGNQIYGWGTADAFNPTSYFNPSDTRELIFRDDDEDKAGVPSLSGMFFLGDYTLEAVFVPVHIPVIMPPEGNFWSLPVSDSYFEAIILDDPEEFDIKISHCGYGLRLSTSAGGVDISLSGYRGPDKDPLFIPDEVLYLSGMPVGIRVKQRSSVVSMLGVDFSSAIGDFVVQCEAVYSPDKSGVVEQNLNNPATVGFPFEVDRYNYISYATGFNYFIPMDRIIEGHTGDAVFTFEWFQSKYLEGGVYSPFITDIISCKFQDSYLDGRIKMTIKALFDTQHGGKIFWPEVEYDFQNGLSVALAYADIRGERGSTLESDSIFSYYRDNDLLMAKFRYEY